MARRVAARLLVGFGLYFILDALWLFAGLDAAYDRFVWRVGLGLAGFFTHFPVGAGTLQSLEIHNQGHALLLILALATVSGLPWRLRAVRYSTLAATVVAAHVVSLALQTSVDLALRFRQSSTVDLMLPWELELHRRAFTLCFAYGLQIGPFLALALTGLWTSGHTLLAESPSLGGVLRRQRVAIAALVGLALLGSTGLWLLRERDATHARAHVVVGDLFARRGQDRIAHEQFNAALRGRPAEAAIWLRLAAATARLRGSEAAIGTLERAHRAVKDSDGRQAIESAITGYSRQGTAGSSGILGRPTIP